MLEILTESVKYTFPQIEMIEIAKDQARHMSSMGQLEDEFENLKAAHKSKVTRLEADISDCTRRVMAGYEMRPVRCLVLKFRPDNDHALIVRTDNGRVLRKRKLGPDERQPNLITDDPEAYIFMADFFQDTEGDLSEEVAKNVPLYEKEAKELSGVIEMTPLRKMLDQGSNGK